MTRILITGIGGLIGSRLAHWIQAHVPDALITGIDDFSCGYHENVPPEANLWTCTLGKKHRAVKDLFDTMQPEYVFHCAAYAAEGLSPFIRRYNYENNLLATTELISAAIDFDCVRRFVFFSSMAVYGRGIAPFTETDPRDPIDPYGVAKAACEQDLAIAGEQHGLDWCIIRPHNVYGAQQDLWTPYRNVLGIWMARALEGLPLRVYGDGLQQRAFSHVEDCLPCLWRAATEPAASRETINVGGTQPVTIREAAELVRSITGAQTIEYCEPRHEVKQAWTTWQKSVDLLGYSDKTPLYAGIEEMWQWAQIAWKLYPERRNRTQPFTYETTRGLYSFWNPR